MNREIKFRAWDEVNKEMIYPKKLDVFSANRESWWILKSYENVMQYTGLKDKAGKEIFEGDIIADADLSYVVLFGEFQFEECDFVGFYLKEIPLYCREHNIAGAGGPIGSVDQSVINVLGNIHQNLELLLKPETQC